MGTRKFSIVFSPKRFRQALEARGMSIYKLGQLAEEKGITTRRSITRNLKTGTIRPNVLAALCKIMDVDSDYIVGRVLIPMGNAAPSDVEASTIDSDGILIPAYQSIDYSGFKDSQKALKVYLVTRGFRAKINETGEYVPVSEEWFDNYVSELEPRIYKAVADFINEKGV